MPCFSNLCLLLPSRYCLQVLQRVLDSRQLLPPPYCLQVLQRVLDSRQLSLKLISNVTYGYTAAAFSGRMPCAELADSIVQCGEAGRP